jgi:hypothetical protein
MRAKLEMQNNDFNKHVIVSTNDIDQKVNKEKVSEELNEII